MTRIEEGDLVFEFGDKWRVICSQKIKVILWLEQDLPDNPFDRKKVELSIRIKRFKQKLSWLTYNVLVCSSDKQCLPDVKVSNLSKS
jgi:hypothetical protein